MKKVLIFFLLICLPSFTQGIVVEILVDDSYPPYSYEEGGEAKGIYVDILESLDEKMLFFSFRIKAVPWKRGLKLLEIGSSFALAPPYYRPDERPYMFYSKPILKEELVLVSLREKEDKEWPFDYVKDKIGINSGFSSIKDEDSFMLDIEEGRSTKENLLKLFNGRIDYYINDKYSILYELEELISMGKVEEGVEVEVIKVLSEEYGYMGYSIKSNVGYKNEFVRSFDIALEELKETDEIDKIIDEFLSNLHK